jgi:ureidoacrylate peracid hydrolase
MHRLGRDGFHMATIEQKKWSLNVDKTALLVVDMQRDFVEKGAIMEVPMARARVPAMQSLVKQSRASGIPVIFTRHLLLDGHNISPLEVTYQPWLRTEGMREGHPGSDIIPDLAPEPGEIVIEKHRYDGFYNTRLETVLRNIGKKAQIDTLIIAGTVTSVCCESTARSAFMRDFKVLFVADATGGFDDTSQAATLEAIGRVFGHVVTTQEILEAIG